MPVAKPGKYTDEAGIDETKFPACNNAFTFTGCLAGEDGMCVFFFQRFPVFFSLWETGVLFFISPEAPLAPAEKKAGTV